MMYLSWVIKYYHAFLMNKQNVICSLAEATEDNCVLFVRITLNNKDMRDVNPWKFIFLHLMQQF